MSLPPMLLVYRGATTILGPLAGLWLAARAHDGKEDRARVGERYGRYPLLRPAGSLVWLHAASVGESGVALQLVEALAARDPALSFLLSTGTRTSAELVARRSSARTQHVYAPLDRPDAVERFIAHWRPDVGVFVESELWPNLILAAQKANVPLALVNARMSPTSLRRLAAWRATGLRLLNAFDFISAADARTSQALTRIAGRRIASPGNLKLAAPAPPAHVEERAALASQIGARPVWLAASTHAGEDEIVLAAHRQLRAEHADALLLIAPRHPERGEAVAALAAGAPRRALGQPISDAPVYVADTLGELGLFYSLVPTALVAGSLLPHLKGHNPVEPAKLGAAILTGPHTESFGDLFAELVAAGGARIVEDAPSLAQAVSALWRDEEARGRQCATALGVVDRGAHALEETANALLALTKARRAHATA